MAAREHTTATRGNTLAILSRDGDGEEHHLIVLDYPRGLVSISDDAFVRVLSPVAAIRLAVELLVATTGRTSWRSAERRPATDSATSW